MLTTALANSISSALKPPLDLTPDLFFVDRTFANSLPQDRTLRITQVDPTPTHIKSTDAEELSIRCFFAALRPEAIFRQNSMPREHPDFPRPQNLTLQPTSWAVVLPTVQDCRQALTLLDSNNCLTIDFPFRGQDPNLQPSPSPGAIRFHVSPPNSIRRSPSGAPEIKAMRCSRCRQTDHQRPECPGILTCIASLRHIKSDAIRGDILDLLTSTNLDSAPAHHQWTRVSPSFTKEGRLLPNLTLHFATEPAMRATLAQKQIQIFLPKGTVDPSVIYPTDPFEDPQISIPLYHVAGCLNCGDPHWHPLTQCPFPGRHPRPDAEPKHHGPQDTPKSSQQGMPKPPPPVDQQPSHTPQPAPTKGPSHPLTVTQTVQHPETIPDRTLHSSQDASALLHHEDEERFTPVAQRHSKRPNLRPTPEGYHYPPVAPTNRFSSLLDLPDSAADPPLCLDPKGAPDPTIASPAFSWADDLPSPKTLPDQSPSVAPSSSNQ